MNERLRNLNKKISNSTIQMDRLMTQLLPLERPLPTPYRQNAYYKNNEDSNPQDLTKKIGADSMGLKNSYVQTNASTKFQESKDKFYSSFKEPIFHQTVNLRANSLNKQIKQRQGRDLINQETKFAVGQHLYPSSIHSQLKIQEVDRKIKRKSDSRTVIKNILEIDYKYVLQHALARQSLHQKSRPQQIFQYFHQFAQFFRKPLIKKFKNCFYFGESLSPQASRVNSKYSGFLYFFTLKIYYGGFENQHKHGLGVQINLKTGVTYKGSFNIGHKIGKFQVFSGENTYEGHLYKGKYHGQGKLSTPISVYVGQFSHGMRNGQGEQYFYESGLSLKGIFEMDNFCNQNQPDKVRQSKQKQIQRTPPKEEKKLPKLNNIFEFSFHDSSDQESNSWQKISQLKWTPRRQKDNKQKRRNEYDYCQMEEASDDDPLPAPFRRMGYNK